MDAREHGDHGQAEGQEEALRRHGAEVPRRLCSRRRDVGRLLRPTLQPSQRQKAQIPLRQPRLARQCCRVSQQRRTMT